MGGAEAGDIKRVVFGGDVMLGRGVGDYILRRGADYPLAPVAALMRGADLAIVNLECAITASSRRWEGAPKAFYFGAPLQAADTLSFAGVDLVSVANNHVLDFGVEGMRDTVEQLQRHGIHYAGAGENREQAERPGLVRSGDVTIGMAAFCDHQEDFAAQSGRPGTAYIDLDDEAAALAALRAALAPLTRAGIDWPVLSLHWGPNMVIRPSGMFRRLAHAAIDMGWKILFGHSAHVFQGIEIYRGCPVIYAAGDLVDDYYVDPEFKNDHQVLFEMELGRTAWRRIVLHPVVIGACQARLASGSAFEHIVKAMTALCGEMGTPVLRDAETVWIAGAGA
jgi:poly-gamma-glutamate synthesis protein (capsule biosynthesis protein)